MPDVNNIPIKWGKYINHDMEEEKVIFIGAEKAIYGADGRKLDEKLLDMEDSLSDAFSETKDYAAGDYCVYANRVFKFTKAKAAGTWDGTAVIPVTLAQEIAANTSRIAALNSQFVSVGSCRFTQGVFDENTVGMQINTVGVQGSQSGLNIQAKMNSGEYRISYLKGDEWTGHGVLALKGDLIGFIAYRQVQCQTALTWAAGEERRVDIPVTIPSGYRNVGVMDAFSDSYNIMASNRYMLNESTVAVSTKNVSSSKSVSGSVYARILLEKIL